MNKTFKKLIVLLLAMVMVLSMSVAAFADEAGAPAPETPIPEASKIPVNHNGNLSNPDDTGSHFSEPGENGTPHNSKVTSDVKYINLIKTYSTGLGSYTTLPTPGEPLNSGVTTAVRPDEEFQFTITPLGAWHVGKKHENTDNIPALGLSTDSVVDKVTVAVTGNETTLTFVAKNSEAEYPIKLSLPDYACTGDYWYQVVERNNKTTGVTYAINNENETFCYFIHVQVVNNPNYKSTDPEPTKLFRSITLHKDGPTGIAISGSDKDSKYQDWVEGTEKKYVNYTQTHKLNDMENEYNAGELTITKQVTGNAGETEKRFQVEVEFTKSSGTIITSDIAIRNALIKTTKEDKPLDTETIVTGPIYLLSQTSSAATDSTHIQNWKQDGSTPALSQDVGVLTNKVFLWIKHGETVIFENIPFGVTYTVKETDPQDGHINKIEYTNGQDEAKDGIIADSVSSNELDADFTKKATGSIYDAKDAIQITNDKDFPIDVGVILDSAPFVAILVVAAAVGVVAVRRKRVIED